MSNKNQPQQSGKKENPQSTEGQSEEKVNTVVEPTAVADLAPAPAPVSTFTEVDQPALAPVPPPAPTPAPTPAPVKKQPPPPPATPNPMARQQTAQAQASFVDNIKANGTAGEQMVVTVMESYLAVMGVNRPLDVATMVREQTRLYTMFKNIGRRTDDFRKTVVAARYFFREHKDGAFHDTRINRGHEGLQMSSDDRRAFYTYLQLFKIFAMVNDLKDVKKSVDLSRSLTNPAVPAEVKERYVSLVN